MNKPKLLIVDDEKTTHEYIKAILEGKNLEVYSAFDGDEGYEQAAKFKPDLIVLDVQMPGKDGFATFSLLKKDPLTADIPVVMLTGIREKRGIGFSKEEMGQFYGKEPDGYLEKPIRPEEIVKLADNYLK